jgi:hypothetical protein
LITGLLFLFAGWASAQTGGQVFKAPNDYRVTASHLEGADIQVFPFQNSNGRDYFCAAADYAIRYLGARTSDRLVIVVPEMPRTGPRDPKSVHFRVVPRSEVPELPGSQGAIDPRRAGENRNIGGSHQFCFRSKSKKKNP